MKLDWHDGALAEGLLCFSRQEFFAAHENWESVWLKCAEPQKSFLQALIQVASAFHHHQRKNLQGTCSLLRRALQRLERFPACFEQVDVAAFTLDLSNWLRAAELGLPEATAVYPAIRIVDCRSEEQTPSDRLS